MAVAGAIAERARAEIPVTWDMLASSPKFGETLLRATIDTTKDKITGQVVAPAAEATYPLIVVDYIGKMVALELLTPGLDAWRNEPYNVNTTGTSEVLTYTEITEVFKDLRKDLLEKTRALWPLVAPLINYTRPSTAPRPASLTIDDEFLTPSPQEFPRPYRVTDRS